MSEIEMEIVKVKPDDRIVAEHTEDLEEADSFPGYEAPQVKRTSLRRKMVFELKKAALTHEEIAEKVNEAYREDPNLNFDHLPKNYDKYSVAQDISRYLDQYKEDLLESAQEMVMVEVERINEMISALWDRVRKVDGPAELKAIDRIIKLQDRKSEFLGLDSPDKFELADRTQEGFSFGWADPSEAPKFKSDNNTEENDND